MDASNPWAFILGRDARSLRAEEPCLHVWVYDGMDKEGRGDAETLRYKCRLCGAVREEKPVKREAFWSE